MHPCSSLLRGTLAWLALIQLALQTGCVSAPLVPTMEVRQQLGTVAIVPAQYIPRTNFATFAKSKPAGAAKGAALAGGESAVAALAFATPYTMILVPFITVMTMAAGAVAGTVGSLPSEKVQEIESTIDAAIAKLDMQRSLAEYVSSSVQKENWIHLRAVDAKGAVAGGERPVYAGLQSVGVDSVLEVAVSEMGFEDSGCGLITGWNYAFCRDKTRNSLMFFMLARARLVRVSDGTELFAHQFRYHSPWREAAQWVANDAQLLAAEIDGAYRDLADRMKDEAFLVTPIALPTPPLWGDPFSAVCWLVPLDPKLEHAANECTGLGSNFGLVDSLRPRLRWSGFPRDLDRAQLDPVLLRTVRDVTYDVKIWEVPRCERGKLVYERSGLSLPDHQVEEPLKPGQRYYWSFRARFSVNDLSMATRWAIFAPNGCYQNEVQDSMYHRFVTPK